MKDCTGDPGEMAGAGIPLVGTVEGSVVISTPVRGSVVVAAEVHDDVRIETEVTGDVVLTPTAVVRGSLTVVGGRIDGYVVIDAGARVEGEVSVVDGGSVRRDMSIRGAVGGVRIAADGRVERDLLVNGTASVGADLVVGAGGMLGRHLRVGGQARIDGFVRIAGTATTGAKVRIDEHASIGGLVISDTARVGHDLWVSGHAEVRASLALTGEATVSRDIWVSDDATIGEDLLVSHDARVMGDLLVSGRATVASRLSVFGRASVGGDVGVLSGASARRGLAISNEATVDGHLLVYGSSEGSITVNGGVQGVRLNGDIAGVRLTPRQGTTTVLSSVARGRFAREVHIGDGVSIAACDFRQCGDLDTLDLVGMDLLREADGRWAKALANPPAGSEERIPDGEMASIYRQLRVNLEGKGNRPASAFFYRGEMDSRRRAARQRGGWAGWTEWGWLSLYRVVAGYGLRVAPPLLWFGAAWVVATVLFLLRGLVVLHGGDYVSASWWQAAAFTLQSMLSVFRPPDALLGLGTTIVQVTLRILGPILLGLAAFAVRDKVAR